MTQDVLIKGNRHGLELIVNSLVEFSDLMAVVEKKLVSAQDFFAKATTPPSISIKGQAFLSVEQKSQLGGLLERYGLCLEERNEVVKEVETVKPLPVYELPPFLSNAETAERQTLFVYKTLRGGQEIRYHGSVAVFGDVNPGARVFAEGDILVTGNNRGVLHAGVLGDDKAIITAGRLAGGQIRIADLIARAPDDVVNPQGPERASVLADQIVIQLVNR
jgi:septum site-determining protein MinC